MAQEDDDAVSTSRGAVSVTLSLYDPTKRDRAPLAHKVWPLAAAKYQRYRKPLLKAGVGQLR